MLHHVRHFFWQILIVLILTGLILLGLVNLSTEKVIAAVTQLGNPPGEVIFRSQVKLDDQSGKVWNISVPAFVVKEWQSLITTEKSKI